MRATKKIWIAETQNDGIIWGHNYDELSDTTTYFYPGSVRQVEISETTYNKLLITDGDNCPCYYLKGSNGVYKAYSF